MSFENYLVQLQKKGKSTFTREQAQKDLSKTRKAILSSLQHSILRGEVVSPAKGFYIIVDPKYRDLGCIPAEFFLPYLMEYWGCKYYAGLLTAASYHGASHHAVPTFYVVTNYRRNGPIICGKVRIKFIFNSHIDKTPVQMISTQRSLIAVSTPEGTIFDLLRHPIQGGGLNNICTVISELFDIIDINKIKKLLQTDKENAWKQRLGYISDLIGNKELSTIISEHLSDKKRVDYILLDPFSKENKSYHKNLTWKIIENTTIESDV